MRSVSAFLSILLLASLAPAAAGEDALPIIEKAFEAARANAEAARDYVFEERVEETRFDRKGRIKKREVKTFDVTLLDGSEYRRLIAVDDEPLDAKAAAKEQRKLEKQLAKMRKETPRQRQKRRENVEQGRKEEKRFLEEITRAFDFRVIGEETVDGKPSYLISAEPKEGYEPRTREAKVLPKIRGKLWISKEDHNWVKTDLETFESIRFAVVVKLGSGARIQFTQQRVNDEVWMIDNWQVRMRARAALVFRFNGEVKGSYGNFRKFTTDSAVVERTTHR